MPFKPFSDYFPGVQPCQEPPRQPSSEPVIQTINSSEGCYALAPFSDIKPRLNFGTVTMDPKLYGMNTITKNMEIISDCIRKYIYASINKNFRMIWAFELHDDFRPHVHFLIVNGNKKLWEDNFKCLGMRNLHKSAYQKVLNPIPIIGYLLKFDNKYEKLNMNKMLNIYDSTHKHTRWKIEFNKVKLPFLKSETHKKKSCYHYFCHVDELWFIDEESILNHLLPKWDDVQRGAAIWTCDDFKAYIDDVGQLNNYKAPIRIE